jgi:hypothetical protein
VRSLLFVYLHLIPFCKMSPSAIEVPEAAQLQTKDVLTRVLKSPQSAVNGFKTPKLTPLDASSLVFEPNPNPRMVAKPGSPDYGKKLYV